MAYNNIFPTSYQPFIPQQQMPQVPQTPQPQQNNNQMIWVQGETGAKSYLLAPTTTLPLWDSENQVIYLKSTDASGMPSMKVLDYTIRDSVQPQTPIQDNSAQPDYVTQDEFKKFVHDIKAQIRGLTKKEAKSNE